jgi:hypothetical protein
LVARRPRKMHAGKCHGGPVHLDLCSAQHERDPGRIAAASDASILGDPVF